MSLRDWEEQPPTFVDVLAMLNAMTAPSRMVDGMIWRVVEPDADWRLAYRDVGSGEDPVWERRDAQDPIAFDPPPYFTSSLDEALELLPEGCTSWSSGVSRLHAWAEVREGMNTYAGTSDWRVPAVALCVSMIRARSALAARAKQAASC